MNKGYYFVRAMTQSQEDFNSFFKNNVVAVGWSKVNFSQFGDDTEALVSKVVEKYYENNNLTPQFIGRKRAEVKRFKNIKEEDKIIVPFPGAICLAEAETDELFSEQDYKRDLSNQRRVRYHRNQGGDVLFIPRNKLSEGFQRRLRLRGTAIADLWEFSEEIESIFKGEDFDSTYNKKQIEATIGFKENILKNIQSGKTNLGAGGRGLEELVKELLEIDGYKARIQSKKRFDGFADADIEAVREDFLMVEKLLVQVKHHSGVTGTWGAKQLTAILKSEKYVFSEFKLVLVTSATPSAELEKLCEMEDIVLVNGNDLSEWIFRSLKKLKYETKKSLGISDVPTLLDIQKRGL